MRKLITLLLTLAMLTATATIPALAADFVAADYATLGSPQAASLDRFVAVPHPTTAYAAAGTLYFGTGADTLGGFGTSTSSDVTVTPDPLSTNIRRNKDAALLPPPYGVFSGDIPTDPSSPYHDNLPESGFVPVNQDLPKTGGEDYATGSSNVTSGLLPSTSQTSTLNTTPWYYEDGTIGTLYVASTKKTIKVYEGEGLDNLAKGAGHFAATSAFDGNVALAGHNRGGSAYFSFVKDLRNGDKLVYTTKYGTRTYTVTSITQIDEWDNLPLSWSSDNILTLITCVAGIPENRFCVVAREAR
jgi:sortase A